MDGTSSKLQAYLDSYWDRSLSDSSKRSTNFLINIGKVSLPHTFIPPNATYFQGSQFYWDTYFTIRGLLVAGHLSIAKNMVDNICFLFHKFGLVPARNSWTSVGRSQPPLLTRAAWAVYEAGAADQKWLGDVMRLAAKEYKVWTKGRRHNSQTHLSSYKPRFFPSKLAVYESGWDHSSRFTNGKHVVPIDLNCLLFQYAQDLAAWHRLCGDNRLTSIWHQRADSHKQAINNLLWDEAEGFFFDYNQRAEAIHPLKTLACLYALWCGVADKKQAAKIQTHLALFETPYGLANTEKLVWQGRQWDYPNGWPNLQLIAVEGLDRYNFKSDARRIAKKWCRMNEEVFQKTGTFWEKHDISSGKPGLPGRYATQADFAWSVATYLCLKQFDI